MRPGDVYEVEDVYGPGPHFFVVVSREGLNHGDTVVAVPFTSKKFAVRKNMPNCAPFKKGDFGFYEDCVALGEQVGPLEIDFLSDTPCFRIDDEALAKIGRAIGNVISCRCEPLGTSGLQPS